MSPLISVILILIILFVSYYELTSEKRSEIKKDILKDKNISNDEKLIVLLSEIEKQQKDTKDSMFLCAFLLLVIVILLSVILYLTYPYLKTLHEYSNEMLELYNHFITLK